MKKNLFLSFASLFLFTLFIRVNSQIPVPKIYMPLDIKKAYENGTRTYEGRPGINFWQNTCHYKIQAEMNPFTRELSGREWIEYKNNSQDTINQLVFHLYQDVNKRGSLRYANVVEETNGVVFGSIIVDGDTIKEKDRNVAYTLLTIQLKNLLNPQSSINIEMNWKVKIIKEPYIREGYVDSTSAFIGLWYPKIAAYDDIFSWDKGEYTLKDEFYSPLSTYDVSISLPKGFCVWATGKLQNDGNYSSIINERLRHVFSVATTEVIIDSTTTLYENEIGRDPWKFHADSVPDFAFGFSNHYLWDAAVLKLDGRKILVNTVYPKDQYRNYKHINRVVKDAMEIYSLKDPGLPYPYPCFTTFYGLKGGGMEYPMITFDWSFQDTLLDADVTIHEMLHSYLPFYLLTNETKFAWMDEGFTDFYSLKMLKELHYNMDSMMAWYRGILEPGIRGIGNLPLFTPSTYLNWDNMAGMMYYKPAEMLVALEDMIGTETWKKCFVSFAQIWRYKAPMTYDFIFFVDNYLKRDLYWFWDKWFMHFGYPDLSIQKVDGNKVSIENRGLLPIPFTLHFTDDTEKEKDIIYHADIWKDNNLFEIEFSDFKFSKIEVKCTLIPDFELKDNIWQ